LTSQGPARPPLLVLAVGNPSRGDDALGPLLLDAASQAWKPSIDAGEIELLTDFQLQIEHALDLEGRARVVFVDASVASPAPFSFSRVVARAGESATTHALAPSAVLATYARVVGEPPEAWLLAIRGERFELGEDLTPAAREHLAAGLGFLTDQLERWRRDPGGP